MANLQATADLLEELRRIHATLHSAMDSLMKDLDPNESGRILILMDDKLTTLINRAEAIGAQIQAPVPTTEPPAPVEPQPTPPPIATAAPAIELPKPAVILGQARPLVVRREGEWAANGREPAREPEPKRGHEPEAAESPDPEPHEPEPPEPEAELSEIEPTAPEPFRRPHFFVRPVVETTEAPPEPVRSPIAIDAFASRLESLMSESPALRGRAAPAEPPPPVRAGERAPPELPAHVLTATLTIRKLHGVADISIADDILIEASRRTPNRIELQKVDEGLDVVVRGLAKPLGTVRVSPVNERHIVFNPLLGLDIQGHEPDRRDLEIWIRAMGEVVVRILADIASRRRTAPSSTGSDEDY